MSNYFKGFKHNNARVGKSNVMTPLNWFAVMGEAIIIGGGSFSPMPWPYLFFLAIAIIVFYGAMYVYFAVTDPDRLQTEDFVLASQEMTIASKGNTTPITIDAEAQEQEHPMLSLPQDVNVPDTDEQVSSPAIDGESTNG